MASNELSSGRDRTHAGTTGLMMLFTSFSVISLLVASFSGIAAEASVLRVAMIEVVYVDVYVDFKSF
jgi:hypothetical protein